MGDRTPSDNIHTAIACKEAGRYRDAERILRRALQGRTVRDAGDAAAAIDVGASLMFQGRLAEAVVYYGEVYAAIEGLPALQSYACRALRYQINVLQRLHDADPSERTEANVQQQVLLIEEGLRWVRAVGRPSWRAGFLYHRALAHLAVDEREQALDVAEAAYRSALSGDDESYYCPHDHVVLVARCARLAGRLERALEVLDGAERHVEGRNDEVRGAVERARLLRALTPPRRAEATEEARRAVRLAQGIQTPRDQMFAYEELAVNALAARSVEEAREALGQVCEIAEGTATDDRRFLLRRAVGWLREALNEAAGIEGLHGSQTHDLNAFLQDVAGWLDLLVAQLSEADRS